MSAGARITAPRCWTSTPFSTSSLPGQSCRNMVERQKGSSQVNPVYSDGKTDRRLRVYNEICQR